LQFDLAIQLLNYNEFKDKKFWKLFASAVDSMLLWWHKTKFVRLMLSELTTFVERLKTAPQSGRFDSDKQGSEFVFVVK
jgi:hypothetical protein